MMLTTGMLIFGKMSVGVRTIASPPMIRMSMDTTTNVYGRLSASLTIHIFQSHYSFRPALPDCVNEVDLRSVFRGLSIEGRDQWLSRWGHSNCSGRNDFPRRNLPAVHPAVVAIVRTDVGPSEGHSSKQPTRP